ncbi:DUF6216 family protein [Pseudomonas benzopyrenica]|uniref:DUF6216 family protein n=1 Tax=Pseudomonas benzopyrenica TaxID=2993566 RepID=UPI0039C2F734
MEISDAIDFVKSNTTLILAIGNLIALSAAFIWIWTRTGTGYLLKDYIWKFAGGAPEFTTEEFNILKRRERETEKFKYETGLKIGNLEESVKFARWINHNKITLREIKLAFTYLNLKEHNNIHIKSLNYKLRKWLCVIFIVTGYFAIILLLMIAASSYVMAHFPDSPSFFASKKEFKISIFDQSGITAEKCKDETLLTNYSNKKEFPIAQANSICKSLFDQEGQEWVDKNIKTQKILSSTLIAWILIYCLASARLIAKISAAQKILRRVRENTPELELPFRSNYR